MPLVLVQNEVTVDPKHEWKDVLGQQYHFPNQYRRRVVPGTALIYYRGVRRANKKRGQPEYFGSGVIGDVWPDSSRSGATSKRDWAWYSSIEDFMPFPDPVPAKLNGKHFEHIPSNFWQNGVRFITDEVYRAILNAAGLHSDGLSVAKAVEPPAVVPELATRSLIRARHVSALAGLSSAGGGRPRSPQAEATGDRAEAIVHDYLKAQPHVSRLTWRSKASETPGWDMDYIDCNGELVRVEVKGTTAPVFLSVEITAGEWKAAQKHGWSVSCLPGRRLHEHKAKDSGPCRLRLSGQQRRSRHRTGRVSCLRTADFDSYGLNTFPEWNDRNSRERTAAASAGTRIRLPCSR
jgi:hypothetical protein